MKERIAVYPGSFDLITNGHLDILQRASKAFDKVILLLSVNANKRYVFTKEERLEAMRGAAKCFENVEVDDYDGLVVDYAKKVGAGFIIRGLRAVTDFEFEFQLSMANAFLCPDIDMVFFMAGKETSFISSSTVNELASHGADVSQLVPPSANALYKKRR